MKIGKIRWGLNIIPDNIRFPLFSINERCTIHVALEADGITGYGYAFCFGADVGRVILHLGQVISKPVKGTSPEDWDDVRSQLSSAIVNFIGTQGMGTFILSALDIAMWDLHCKALGKSLQQVL